LLTAVTDLAALALGLTILLDPFVVAAAALYQAAAAFSASALNAAAADATLRSDLTCAIFSAISSDGQVTDANFAAVLTNINGVSYATPGIVGLLHDYVSNLGFNGVNAIQAEGSLYAGDCSACGVTGAAYLFSTTTHTQVTLANDIGAGGAWTVGGWLYGVNASASQTIFALGDGPPGFNHGVFVLVSSGNKAQFFTNKGTGSVGTTGATTLGSGKYHVVCTYDGATMRLYVNGVQDGSVAQTGSTFNETGGVTYFGADSAAKMWRWAWYSSALTAAQVLAWYNAGSFASFPPTPAHSWLFDEGSGTTIHDGSGSDNGTASPTGTWTTHP